MTRPNPVPGVLPAPAGIPAQAGPNASGPIPATAGDPSRPGAVRNTGDALIPGTSSRSINSAPVAQPAGAVFCAQNGGAAEFWRRVNSGEVRLTKAEDRNIGRMRAAGMSFDEIAATFIKRRRLLVDSYAPSPERRTEILRKAWAGRDRAHALRWREQLRAERAAR